MPTGLLENTLEWVTLQRRVGAAARGRPYRSPTTTMNQERVGLAAAGAVASWCEHCLR